VLQKATSKISESEYLEYEAASDIKHEYYQGEIFAMAGASREHNLITANIIGELRNQLKKRPCRLYASDMRLQIEATGFYTYPDVMVVCGQEKFLDEKETTLLNPDIIIEVLSDSTEGYDRGVKFSHYRKLRSLQEYVIVSQRIRKIERYFRNENQQWVLTETDEDNPAIMLEAIDCRLDISEVYDKIEKIQVIGYKS